jgi:hypothetical protein
MRSLIIAAVAALAVASSAYATTGEHFRGGHGRTIELRRSGGQGGADVRHNCRRGHVCRHPHPISRGDRR